MLVKLSLKNIQHSLRDYAIYFFTLTVAVVIFYVFNAVGGQTAAINMSQMGTEASSLLSQTLAMISVFVAVVLGLLIVYASRFLMKRRHREFALYMMLGMSQRRISAMLVSETFLTGLASLGVGLVVGVGLSQLMSALVASMFEADMSAFRFTVSSASIVRTIVSFAIMYLVVMLLNTRAVTRMKLIDLMSSGKKTEQVKVKNPILCTVVFLIAAAILAFAYHLVISDFDDTFSNMGIATLMGCIGTLLLFWSVAGFFLKIALSMREHYLTGLNAFTVRQIASKINTVVFSMSVICIMLFFTITMMSSAFALRNGMMENVRTRCPADFETSSAQMLSSIAEGKGPAHDDVVEHYARYGYDVMAPLGEHVHFHSYYDQNVTLYKAGESATESETVPAPTSPRAMTNPFSTIVRLSDYNKLMDLYGRDSLELSDGKYAVVCDLETSQKELDVLLASGVDAKVFGQVLKSRYNKTQDGFIKNGPMRQNEGFVVVPDGVVNESCAATDYLIGNYNEEAMAHLDETEKMVQEQLLAVDRVSDPVNADDGEFWVQSMTKDSAVNSAIVSGAMMTFVCLYLGVVFLVASGAILALRTLSDSVDSVARYDTLRKIGVDEGDISRSLFKQTGFFFLLPLLVACFHSIFGIKMMLPVLGAIGIKHVWGSIAITCVVILAIYGGYFLMSFIGGKRIIHGK